MQVQDNAAKYFDKPLPQAGHSNKDSSRKKLLLHYRRCYASTEAAETKSKSVSGEPHVVIALLGRRHRLLFDQCGQGSGRLAAHHSQLLQQGKYVWCVREGLHQQAGLLRHSEALQRHQISNTS